MLSIKQSEDNWKKGAKSIKIEKEARPKLNRYLLESDELESIG